MHPKTANILKLSWATAWLALLLKLGSVGFLNDPKSSQIEVDKSSISTSQTISTNEQVALFGKNGEHLQYYVDFLQENSGNHHISIWEKNEVSGNNITFKKNLTYSDIPEFIRIARKSGSPELSSKLSSLEQEIFNKASILIKDAQREPDEAKKQILLAGALKFFYLAKSYGWETSKESITQDFQIFQDTLVGNTKSERNEDDFLAQIRPQRNQNSNNIPFELSTTKYQQIVSLYWDNPRDWIQKLKEAITDFTQTQCLDCWELGKVSMVQIETQFKVWEITRQVSDIQARWWQIRELIQRAQTILSKPNQTSNQVLGDNINQSLQNTVQSDFEAIIYTLLTNDFVLKDAADNALKDSMASFNPGLIAYYIVEGFTEYTHKNDLPPALAQSIKKIQTQWLDRPITNQDISAIDALWGSQTQELVNFLTHIQTATDSKEFKNIKDLLAQKRFLEAREAIEKLPATIKSYAIFSLLSHTGWYIGNITKGGVFSEWYQKDAYEISRLKDKNAKFNCMTIGAVMHHVIDQDLWLTDIGINFSQYKWKFDAHHTNWIQIDGKIYVIDTTSNAYFALTKDHPNFTFDAERYENSFMRGSYHNYYLQEGAQYTKNPFYKGYVDLFKKDYFPYLLSLDHNRSENGWFLYQSNASIRSLPK